MALISAYMEEVRLWFGKIASAGEGFVSKGQYVFYNDVAPAVQDGVQAIKISAASVKDFSVITSYSIHYTKLYDCEDIWSCFHSVPRGTYYIIFKILEINLI